MPPGKDQSREILSDRLRLRSRRLLYFELCNLPIICVVPAAYPGFCSGEMRDEQEFSRSLSAAAQGALTMGAASKVAAPAITAVSLSRCTHTSYFPLSRRDSVRAESLSECACSLLCSAPPPPLPSRVMDAPTQAPAPVDIPCGRRTTLSIGLPTAAARRLIRMQNVPWLCFATDLSRFPNRLACVSGASAQTPASRPIWNRCGLVPASNNGEETARAYVGHV
jgi:hypothetical protein